MLTKVPPPHHPSPIEHPHPPTTQANPHPFKGLDLAEKKLGGGKINPQQSRGINEKITDSARGLLEKATGYVESPLSFFLHLSSFAFFAL